MRIITLDLPANPPEPCNLEVPLRRLAASPEPLTAARWQKLLELVLLLQAEGPYPEAVGIIRSGELDLGAANAANRITVVVSVDWYDGAPLENGLPVMHYRVRIRREGANLSEELRSPNPQVADQKIREAFG